MAKRDVDIFINARDKASKNFKKVGGNFKGMASTIKSSAGLIAGVLTAGFAARFVQDLTTQADTIGKVSKRIGITAEEYQKYTFAARRAGATNADIEKSFKRMQSGIFDAENGLGEATNTLDSLGVSLDSLRGKTQAEQFNLIANSLNDIEDAGTKAALAQDIFGKSGTALIPMIADFEALGDEAQRTGRIMSNEAVQSAEDYKDSIENLTTSFKAMVANSGVIDWLSDVAGSVDDLASSTNTLKNIFDAVSDIFDPNAGKTQTRFTDVITAEDIADKRQDVAGEKKLKREKEIVKIRGEAARQAMKEEAAQKAAKEAMAKASKTLKKDKEQMKAKAPVDLSTNQFNTSSLAGRSSRFLSFRDTAGGIDQTAKATETATKKTADNTGQMVEIFGEFLQWMKTTPTASISPLRL